METVFEELMRLVSVTKMLADDVSKHWSGFPPRKQYAYGLLGRMLLMKTAAFVEAYRKIPSDDDLVIMDRFSEARINLNQEQLSIIERLEDTEWSTGYEEQWSKTNDLDLCRDIIVAASGCAQVVLDQLGLEKAQGIDYTKSKYTRGRLFAIAFHHAYSQYFQTVDEAGNPIKGRYEDFDYESLSYEEMALYDDFYSSASDDCEKLFYEVIDKEDSEEKHE